MAIFGNKKEDKKEDKKTAKKAVAKKAPAKKTSEEKSAPVSTGNKDVAWVLKKPRLTEKSAYSAEKKVYVFEVDPRATKKDVSMAVSDLYKVTPKKVNIAKIASKKVTRRKRSGTTSGVKSGGKKAFVYLKEGDTIEFV